MALRLYRLGEFVYQYDDEGPLPLGAVPVEPAEKDAEPAEKERKAPANKARTASAKKKG